MNTYRHSTNSVYTLNPHLNIPISSSTTIPPSAYHFNPLTTTNSNQNKMTKNSNSNNEDMMDQDTSPRRDDQMNQSPPSLKTSQLLTPSNLLKTSQPVPPPPKNNNNNSNNNNVGNFGHNVLSPSSSFNESLNQAAASVVNGSGTGSLPSHTTLLSLQPTISLTSTSPNSTTSNPFLKLSTLPDSSPPLSNASPFSFSSSALFSNQSNNNNNNNNNCTFPSTSTTSSTSNRNSFNSSLINHSSSSSSNNNNHHHTQSNTYMQPQSTTAMGNYAASLLDEDRERMRYEYESIKKPEAHPSRKTHKHHQRHYSYNDLDNRKHDEEKFFSSLQPNNYSKNRYHDVLPNEATRVRLTPIEGGDGDYINANYINGEVPNSYRHFIACQAPLASTIKDFWRMVWEERSAVIVCLTKLEEDGKKKADIYWPESSSEDQECGSFWVHLHKKVMFKDIGVSSLLLYKKGEEFPREVMLLHYTHWPDSGTPTTSTHIRTLSVLVNSFKQRGNTKSSNGPVIVHCSAGIGRSGTFIAISINIAKIERSIQNNEPNCHISIKDTVSELRRQRRGMVQTFDQYVFIYKVINDVLHDMGGSLASPTKRRSCEIRPSMLQHAMPRLDINNQTSLTLKPNNNNIQSTISPSADTAASLSIITQMTQTLRFPQSTSQFDSNPFSKSNIKIPSPLNVSSSNVLTINGLPSGGSPPTSSSNPLSNSQQLLNDSLNQNNITNICNQLNLQQQQQNNNNNNNHHQSQPTNHFTSLSSHHLFNHQRNLSDGHHSFQSSNLINNNSNNNNSFLIYQHPNQNNSSSQQQQVGSNNSQQQSSQQPIKCSTINSFLPSFQRNNDPDSGGNGGSGIGGGSFQNQLNGTSFSTNSSSSSQQQQNNQQQQQNNNRKGGNQDNIGNQQPPTSSTSSTMDESTDKECKSKSSITPIKCF